MFPPLSGGDIKNNIDVINVDSMLNTLMSCLTNPNVLSPFDITMIWGIDLVFGLRVYNDKLQINFEIHSGWMIFGQLTAVGLNQVNISKHSEQMWWQLFYYGIG
jgi:hypothetical protein